MIDFRKAFDLVDHQLLLKKLRIYQFSDMRILKKQYAYLQTILKTPVKFQKDSPKTVGGVADTRYILHIHICSIRARKISNRTQQVVINDCSSVNGDVLCGVPQGSILKPVLKPLLFLFLSMIYRFH